MLTSLGSLWLAVSFLCSHSSAAPYSEADAQYYLNYAYGAYCNAISLQQWSCKFCSGIAHFKTDVAYNDNKLQGFTGYDLDRDMIVIAFRGTVSQDLRDFIYDADAWPRVRYPTVDGGKVHRGFYNGWQTLKVGMWPSIQSLVGKYPSARILITGHSLGAGIGQIASLDVANLDGVTGDSITLYTYGCPRWGNEAMANYSNDLIIDNWRVTNKKDIIPTLPPEHSGYRHTRTETHYTSIDPLEYYICDGSGEDPTCDNNVVDDHTLDDHYYYLNVEENCRCDDGLECCYYDTDNYMLDLSLVNTQTLTFMDESGAFTFEYTPCRDGIHCGATGNMVEQLNYPSNTCESYLAQYDSKEDASFDQDAWEWSLQYKNGNSTDECRWQELEIRWVCSQDRFFATATGNSSITKVVETSSCIWVMYVQSQLACP